MTRPLALLTDFGPGSVYVGQMHLAVRRVLPDAIVVDLAHDVPPGDVEAAAYLLEGSLREGPPDVVVVVVVDPGVGTARRILAARVGDALVVGPDNGLLAAIASGHEVRAVAREDLLPASAAPTFHGRDIMAPLGARLAAGLPLAQVGPPVVPVPAPAGPTLEADGVTGRVLLADRFGNLVTNIPRRVAEMLGGGGDVRVRIDGAFVDGLSRTFADVPPGNILAYVGSGGNLEIAIHGDSAARLLRLDVGAPIRVERRVR